MTRTIAFCLLASASLAGAPALAQDVGQGDSADEAGDYGTTGEIVVTAESLRGRVVVSQPPIDTLNEEDIATLGVSSFEEVLAEIAPQAGSGRGRGGGHPVVLLNGARISGFRELRDYPPEAIRRVEVLAEEVALRYGFGADQRVVNFILKDNFAARTAEVEYGLPTAGGYATYEIEGRVTRLDGGDRLNLGIEADDSTALTEAERGIVQSGDPALTLPGDPDPARFRTLVADSSAIEFSANWATGFGEGPDAASLSLNATASQADRTTLSGLDTVLLTAPGGESARRALLGAGVDPRQRRTLTDSYAAGATLNKPLGGWNLTATADWNHENLSTRVDRRADSSALVAAAAAGTLAIDAPLADLLASADLAAPGVDTAVSRTDSVTTLATLVGSPLGLPAGDVSLTLDAGYDWDGIESRDTRGTDALTALTRGDVGAGFSLAVPIASRRRDVLSAVGDLSLDLSAGINELSDFGTLTDWSAGLTWGITPNLSLQASYITREVAPTLIQLGAPEVLALDVPVFDFTRGETVLANLVEGGNPALIAEKQRDWKFGLTWQLPFLDRSSFIAEYFRNRSSDVTRAFPLLTPQIEAAFPGRVLRDAAGRLVQIDQRPVTFASEQSERIRYGFNLSGDLGKAREAEGGGRGRGGGPRFGRGGDDDGQGRWRLSLYHTWRFDETIRVSETGPVLDLLGGDALSDNPTARHELEMRGGLYYRGFGLRLGGSYLGGADVETLGGNGDLRFHPIAKFDARLFVDLDQRPGLIEDVPLLKGTRLSFRIDNIFDAQQRVTDASGMVPLRYQPGFLDPQGRFVEFEIRKRF